MRDFVTGSLAIAVVLTISAGAQAQEATDKPAAAEGAAPAEATTSPAPAPAPAPAPEGGASGAVTDGTRFRFGVAGGMGFFSVGNDAGGEKMSSTYFGADLRFGAQINNLVGVYAQLPLGYYSADGSGGLLGGGLLGFAAVADVTVIDRFFFGAGLGYTVYNSPGGFSPILRIGGYPLMSHSDEKARRKGLMLGMDLRITSLEGLTTIVMPTFNIGYEAF
jgi:hypothetical protein